MSKSLQRAVFLDRDGTINEEREYLWRVEDFRFIEGSVEAIRMLKNAGFLVVVVTNQSGIGRGYYSVPDLEKLHNHMQEELSSHGTEIDAYYYCPHHPLHGKGIFGVECDCRKPLPGMLLQAAEDLDIDLSNSWMIGDKRADVDAGIASGCRSILVKTGYGSAESGDLPESVNVFEDLLTAASAIINNIL